MRIRRRERNYRAKMKSHKEYKTVEREVTQKLRMKGQRN